MELVRELKALLKELLEKIESLLEEKQPTGATGPTTPAPTPAQTK
jgi:hypothetical protein